MAGDQFIELLCSPMKLERDRAANELVKYLPNAESRAVEELCDSLLALLEDKNRPWECRHGALLGVKGVLPFLKPGEGNADEFIRRLKINTLQLLLDAEVRVRMGAAEVLGKLCACYGPGIYLECKETVLHLISSNLERNVVEDSAASQMEMQEKEKLIEKFASSQNRGVDAERIFHDTAGWKSLETSMKALQAMVDGCGVAFEPHINQELLDLVFQSLTHTNRFVRETGFYVCASLICSNVDGSSNTHDDDVSVSENNALLTFGHQFSRFLGIGLSDNWSQVRLAAATAARKFLLALPDEIRQNFYPELLPKLCMNRYYLAEGVRLYSQETWRQVAGTEGRELVQKHIDTVVKYYVEQSGANNHAVREAACSCIAELATKLNPHVVTPYVEDLLETLLVCFQDDSWPVRDAACLACGNFVLSFPEESRGSLEKLYPLFFANLEDNITSVRQGAAASLVNIVKAYGSEALLRIVEKATIGLQVVENQPEESKKYSNLETGPAPFGIVKRLRDNDMELHTNQTMYSCGSLAPKMSRGGGGAGCSGCLDRSFRREPQPWEIADGCVYLVSELSSLPQVQPYIPNLLHLVAKAATFRHYTHHVVLLETICKQLPVIAKGVGKKNFKPHLEAFLEPIFYSLSCENSLTSSAASQSLNQLGAFLGPNILRSRVEQFNPTYMEQLDANLHIAPF